MPIIGFPRGAGQKIERYVQETGVQGVGCDTGMEVAHMAELARARNVVVQGNLDPLALVAGGAALERQADELLRGLARRAAHLQPRARHRARDAAGDVARLVELVRGARRMRSSRAPQLADGWIPGPSPGMTTACCCG